ncbi:MAG: hypothetical protein F6K11_24000 [Leptolyngbya sp. SIO3F4]|nr:hypothetical protein [Leptolyngbya sp. SIO3F4]
MQQEIKERNVVPVDEADIVIPSWEGLRGGLALAPAIARPTPTYGTPPERGCWSNW